MRRLLISEVYGPVIQGEGPVVGVPTVFVRLGGCDFRCEWCDSLYAVLPKYKNEWIKMTVDEILSTVDHLTEKTPILITLSGGNPALQDCGPLIDGGHLRGHRFAIETQGSKFPEWAYLLDEVVISPKPPSSKMVTDWDLLRKWVGLWPGRSRRSVKVVVFDEEDYIYAKNVYDFVEDLRLPAHEKVSFFFQVGTREPYRDTSSFETLSMFRNDILSKLDWLGNRVVQDKLYGVRVLPQTHALIHGAKRGV